MKTWLAWLPAAGLCILGLQQDAAAQDLLITNARILDGNGGVIERGSIAVENGRIVSVEAGSGSRAGETGRRIDAGGNTVMPAFIDAHRHIIQGDPVTWLRDEARERMQAFLDAGFTTVLSAGDPLEQILELDRRIEAGEMPGPRLIVAGRVRLSRSPGRVSPDVDPARADIARPPLRPTEAAEAIPPAETRAAVRRLAEAGVDAIKTAIIVTPGGPEQKTLALVADEAERYGLTSITHAVTVMDTIAAVEAGTHVLAHTPHIGLLDEATARRIADAGIPMVSTLAIFVPRFGEENEPLFRDDLPFPFETLSSAGIGPVNARLLWEAGITYAYGTDTRWHPRETLAHELRPLQLVFSPRDIVAIITRNAAVAVGLPDEIGTLEPGKAADIVVLGGNPLDDPSHLLDVRMVVRGGEVVVDHRPN